MEQQITHYLSLIPIFDLLQAIAPGSKVENPLGYCKRLPKLGALKKQI